MSSHYEGTTPFKVHINFDIPLFERKLNIKVLVRWLNILDGYFFVHNFSNNENITFTLLKSLAHKYWWDTCCVRHFWDSKLYVVEPT
jgi:hypothetical protein